MNIEQYLQEEFEVYPAQFRKMAAYAPAEIVQQALRQGGVAPSCACSSPEVVVDEIKPGQFKASCLGCQSVGPVQKSEGLAIWGWKGCKHQLPTWESPLLKDNELSAMQKRLVSAESSQKRRLLIEWLAEIKLHQRVWSAHRKTPLLWASDDELSAIDAIGLVSKLMRKNALHELSKIGVVLTDGAVQEELDKAEVLVARKRRGYFAVFESNLSPTFREHVAGLLGIANKA